LMRAIVESFGKTVFPKDSTMARIKQRGVLVVGVKFDQLAFGYKDPASGRITGFDAEMARLVARAITGSERNIQFIESVTRNREDFLSRGVVDLVIATYSMTPERRTMVDFTAPYYYAGQDLLVRTDDTGIRGVTDLAGKEVCSAVGSTSVRRLRSQAPRAKLILASGYSECVPSLLSGKVDAISTDDTVLFGVKSQHPDAVKIVGKPFGVEPYGIGVRHGDAAFRDYLDGLLRRWLRDGSWDRAYRDTIGAMDTAIQSFPPAGRPDVPRPSGTPLNSSP